MQTLIGAIIGFLIGAIVGRTLWSGKGDLRDAPNVQGSQVRGAIAADRAAIERLHQQDIDVTLVQEQEGLADVWAKDGVRIRPDGTAVVGKQAIDADNAKFRATYPEFKVVKYEPDLSHFSVAIGDGWAVEVGTLAATYKLSGAAEPISVNDRAMRLLRRETDGSWKFALVGMK
jgi:ketosteroid isomerase-like protein